jgi:hypothetical protein
VPLGRAVGSRDWEARRRSVSGEALPWKPTALFLVPCIRVGPDRIIISLEQVQSDLWMLQLPVRNSPSLELFPEPLPSPPRRLIVLHADRVRIDICRNPDGRMAQSPDTAGKGIPTARGATRDLWRSVCRLTPFGSFRRRHLITDNNRICIK